MTQAFRPELGDLARVALLASRAVMVVAASMLVPAALGLVTGEIDAAAALVLGACVGLSLGAVA